MGLYQKYRPTEFADIVGNKNTVAQLSAMVESGKVPHAVLLHGPKGCGKTTMGRILARKLGCKGSDYAEMDTATYRGINDIRDIRRKVFYKPMESSCRVWLLDECHQITSDGQEALLKALEDTPEHAYFIMCTTDPQKLKNTIRSRCAQFPVEELAPREIGDVLKRVCIGEKRKVPIPALKMISEECMGSPRDALVLLEQIIPLKEEEMQQAVSRLAEEVNETNKMCQLLLKENVGWKDLASMVESVKGDPETVRRQVLGYMAVVLTRSGNPRAYSIMDCFSRNYFDLGRAGLVMSCWEVLNEA